MKCEERGDGMTVAEFIAKLQELPQDKPIGIVDADSSWWGPVIHIYQTDRNACLSIDYEEMIQPVYSSSARTFTTEE